GLAASGAVMVIAANVIKCSPSVCCRPSRGGSPHQLKARFSSSVRSTCPKAVFFMAGMCTPRPR
ncbi:hypothetical protein, partial [Escherichia coli]|uniref:hypothetical protein n=1 Tax=Escherichia coli TaxID=562 RepID=UPI001BD3EA0E